jgi:hypothetical protein
MEFQVEVEKMRSKIVFTMLGVLLCTGGLAQAELITLAISGQVNSVTDPYGNPYSGLEGVYSGAAITGTYTYDSTTLDMYPSDPSFAQYWSYATPVGISLEIAGFSFKTDPTNVKFYVEVQNDNSFGEDIYSIGSYYNLFPLSDATLSDSISWELVDSTGTALSRDALPLTAPDLTKWDNTWRGNLLHIDSSRGGQYVIQGTITSAVPEPCSALFMIGGIALIKRRTLP